MAKSFLIVGGSGQVGSNIARSLREAGHSVRITTSKAPVSPDQVQVDLLKGEGLDAAFQGVQRVFLMSPAGYPDQYQVLSPLIRKAKEKGLEKVVLMTAQGVEMNDAAPFRRAEVELEKSGLAFNIIRPSWFMQNFHTYWLHDIRTHGTIRLPAGEGRNAFIDSRDIADVAATLLSGDRFPGQAFTLTGPESLDHKDVARILSAATGKTIGYQDITPEEFRKGLLAAGLSEAYTDLLVLLVGFLKANYVSAVSDAVPQILGRPARTLAAYAGDYKANWA
ncbi:MAG TPA: SDR family oxidoreductase [Fibrobacteria bacterium]|nr:SDR family oxidoreductase [Fibrobacteria bacterium]